MLSRNSSSAEIFKQSKPAFAEALKNCGCKAKIQYIQPNLQENNARRITRKMILFNPAFSLNVKKNMAKMFWQLIEKTFPSSKQFT